MKPLLLIAPLAFLTLLQAESTGPAGSPPPEKKPPVVLEKYVVNEEAQLSFGFGIRIVRNGSTRRAFAMYVDRVAAGSDADKKGLKSQSEIIAIDGKPVSEYEATFNTGSELARIFIGRKEGASVILQVIPLGKQKPQTLKIVKKMISNEFHKSKIGGLPFD